LSNDPGYGLKFNLALDAIPEWRKYKSQDHALFITSPEQKTGFSLTDDPSKTQLLTET